MIDWLLKLLGIRKSGKTVVVQPLPDTEPEPPADTNTTTTATTEAEQPKTATQPTLIPATYSLAGCTIIAKREGGFVNNPNCSRKRLKIILPSKYSGRVARVVAFCETPGAWAEELKRGEPNEYGNRQRYYGMAAPTSYPFLMWIRWDCNDSGVSNSYAYRIDDVTQREG